MASGSSFGANFLPRLPGKTREGSQAYYRRGATLDARADMADVIRRYQDLIRNLEMATPTILYNALVPVFNKSQVYVPKKTGALMGSGHLEVGTDERGKPEARITYGDASTPYAAIVHEFTHLNHEPPTRAKYLQSALEEEMDSFLTSVAVDYLAVMV